MTSTEVFQVFEPVEYNTRCLALWGSRPVILSVTPVNADQSDLEKMKICPGVEASGVNEDLDLRSRECSKLVDKTMTKCSACKMFEGSTFAEDDSNTAMKHEIEGLVKIKIEVQGVDGDSDIENFPANEDEDYKTENNNAKIKKIKVTKAAPAKKSVKKITDPKKAAQMLEKLLKRKNMRKGKKPWPCGKCGMVLPHKTMLRLHMTAAHTLGNITKHTSNICDHCGFVAETPMKLHNHVGWYHDEDLYNCDMCGESVRGRLRFNSHKHQHKNINRNKDPVPCPECGKEVVKLTEHINTVHQLEELKRHKCKICGKGFHTKYRFDEHVKIHSDVRPHGCRFCDFHSKSKGNLTKHEKQRHPVEFENAM